MKKTIGHRVKWEWDEYGTYGYNIMAKFEQTLISFGLLADYSDIDVTEEFDRKYGMLPSIRRAQGEYARLNNNFKYTNKPDEGSCGCSVNFTK